MLSCDGYVPWTVFVRRFAAELENRMSAWAEQTGSLEVDSKVQGWSGKMNLAFKNCAAAAQSLALHAARRRGGRVHILTPMGFMPTISVRHFSVDKMGMLRLDKGDGQSVNYYLGNPAFYNRNDWQEHFAARELFHSRRPDGRGFLDWGSGSITIAEAVRETRYKATAVLKQAVRKIEGSEVLAGMVVSPEDAMDVGLVAVLRPYHGNPVVVPESWIKESPQDSGRAEVLDEFGDLPPAERILALLDENPAMNKAEVKEVLFPSASERRFLSYWESAALAKPEISRPGRKRARV